MGLRETLGTVRSALDQYRGDQGNSPESLGDLVSRGYLRSVPFDPMTKSRTTWRVIRVSSGAVGDPERLVVVDIRSGAEGTASDGTMYSSW
jgi:general secretion pathway protein G